MKRLRMCTACTGFVPEASDICPHCELEQNRDTRASRLLRAALKLGGSAAIVTLWACGDLMPPAQALYGVPTPNTCEDLTEDLDGDGHCGDYDCNEEDATIYVGAEDPLGDDIDQNCDGEDGTAAASLKDLDSE